VGGTLLRAEFNRRWMDRCELVLPFLAFFGALAWTWALARRHFCTAGYSLARGSFDSRHFPISIPGRLWKLRTGAPSCELQMLWMDVRAAAACLPRQFCVRIWLLIPCIVRGFSFPCRAMPLMRPAGTSSMTRGREMEIQFASQLIAYIPACTKISLWMLKEYEKSQTCICSCRLVVCKGLRTKHKYL
jgi:hypothetical protein